jgi:hypothetical protein
VAWSSPDFFDVCIALRDRQPAQKSGIFTPSRNNQKAKAAANSLGLFSSAQFWPLPARSDLELLFPDRTLTAPPDFVELLQKMLTRQRLMRDNDMSDYWTSKLEVGEP